VFGLLVGIVSTLLIAPQTTEFGAKVGLLSGLVIVCAARPILERILPEPKSAEDRLRAFLARIATGGNPSAGGARRAGAALAGALAVVLVGGGIVLAGTPARGTTLPVSAEVLNRLPTQVDPATLPPVTVGQDVVDFDETLAGSGINDVLITLAQNLALENEAMLHADSSVLAVADHGDRLAEMNQRLLVAQAAGRTILTTYRFTSGSVSLLIPFGKQDGFSLGFHMTGTQTQVTRDASGATVQRVDGPLDLVFAVRRATGDRWLLVAVLPPS
jgi:hypothetical protein